jgi:hypothetical protein
MTPTAIGNLEKKRRYQLAASTSSQRFARRTDAVSAAIG